MANKFFEDDIVEVGDVATPAAAGVGMTYSPTLLIGLGGTGAEVLLRVKTLLQARNADYEESLHRFLFIDTDLRAFAKKEGLPEIDPSEQSLIGFKTVQDLLDHPDLYPHIWDRFPREALQEDFIRRLAHGTGASQIRSLGALALALDYGSVRGRMQTAYNDLIQLSNRVQTKAQARGASIGGNVVIYLVASLAGGTGAGCFLDVALMALDVCKARNPKLAGLFALPAAYDPKVAKDPEGTINIRANTYMSLKELQFCLDASEEDRKALGAVSYVYGDTLQTLTLDPSRQVFNLCFLIDDRSASGKLTRLEDLYSLTARAIYQEVGSPFGANMDSFNSNLSTSTGIATCKKTSKKRLFGTTSNASLIYPADRVATYCTFRTTDMVIHDYLLGAELPASDTIRSRVSAFLDANEFDDRSPRNQVLESVLHDPRYGGILSADAYALDPSWEAKDAAEFVSLIQSERDRFTNTEIPQLKDMVAENAQQRLGGEETMPNEALRGIVQDFALAVAAESGARAASEVLEELAEVAVQIQSELARETVQWRTDEQVLSQDFNAFADELAQMSSIKQVFSKRDERLKQQLMTTYNDYVQESLWAVARPAALTIVEALINRARDVKTEWDGLVGKLDRLRRAIRTRAAKLETHKGYQRADRFVVEQEVTLPGYERRYYEQNKLENEDALALVLEPFEGRRQDLLREALHMSEGQIGNTLARALYATIAPPLLKMEIVDFVANHPDEVEEHPDEKTMARKLDLLFDLCQPFWPAANVGNVQFPDYRALSVKPAGIDDDGRIQYPTIISQWAAQQGYETLPSHVPYEITLGRRTYGARAFYLRPAVDWKRSYASRQETSEGRYMMETHIAFRDIPDLFPKPPEDTRPLLYFALGSALGFIVRRGDWYYYGLEKMRDAGGSEFIRVLYESQDWTTIQDLERVPGVPPQAGSLDFTRKKTTSPDRQRHMLGQGRETAIDVLTANGGYVDLLEEAFNEYHGSVGNDALRQQFGAYCERVLEPKEVGEDIFYQEREAILNRLGQIGR